MKSEVNAHALAIGTIMVEASAGQTELQIYEHQCGGVFAIDGSFLEQVVGDPAYISDPFNEGSSVQLIDHMKEKSNKQVIGEEHDEELIDQVLENMANDIESGDTTAIAELLQFVPIDILKGYLPD